MKLFSRASECAILAMVHAIQMEALDGFSTSDVCQAAGIPEPFGRKALVALAKGGILVGTRGPGGGYRLARPAKDVSLLDIVLSVDGPDAFSDCPLGVRCAAISEGDTQEQCRACRASGSSCGIEGICPLHGLWGETRQRVVAGLQRITLGSMQKKLGAATG